MTFGPNALRGLLHPQAYRICLGLQKYLHRYLDIVKEFTKAFPTTPAPTTVKDLGTSILCLKGPADLALIAAAGLAAAGLLFCFLFFVFILAGLYEGRE